MKLQIDTDKKAIKVEGKVQLKEFFEQIKDLLSDWDEYTLESVSVINNFYKNHHYIKRHEPSWSEPYWVSNGTTITTDPNIITCEAKNTTLFNLEV